MLASTTASLDPFEVNQELDMDLNMDLDTDLFLTDLPDLDVSTGAPPDSSHLVPEPIDKQAVLTWHQELDEAQRLATHSSSRMFTSQGVNQGNQTIQECHPLSLSQVTQQSNADTSPNNNKPGSKHVPFSVELLPDAEPNMNKSDIEDVEPRLNEPNVVNSRSRQEKDLTPMSNHMISMLNTDVEASNKVLEEAQAGVHNTQAFQVPSESNASVDSIATASASVSATGSSTGTASGSVSEKPVVTPSGAIFPPTIPEELRIENNHAISETKQTSEALATEAQVDAVDLGHVLDDVMDTAAKSEPVAPAPVPVSYQPTLPMPEPIPAYQSNSASTAAQVPYRARTRGIRKRQSMYRCPVAGCERAFPLKSNLKKHRESVHLKMRPYACHICSRTFYERCKLRGHIATVHDGKRDFPCPYSSCEKAFKQNSDLKRHIREVHQKLKRY